MRDVSVTQAFAYQSQRLTPDKERLNHGGRITTVQHHKDQKRLLQLYGDWQDLKWRHVGKLEPKKAREKRKQ